MRVLRSNDLNRMEVELNQLAQELLPCTADRLHWLLSTDENGRYLSIFNNEGNERSSDKGDEINHAYNKRVTVTLKDGELFVFKPAIGKMDLERIDDKTYRVTIPAADFAIFIF